LVTIRISIEGILICPTNRAKNSKLSKNGSKALKLNLIRQCSGQAKLFLMFSGRQVLLNLFNQTSKLEQSFFYLPLLTIDGQRKSLKSFASHSSV